MGFYLSHSEGNMEGERSEHRRAVATPNKPVCRARNSCSATLTSNGHTRYWQGRDRLSLFLILIPAEMNLFISLLQSNNFPKLRLIGRFAGCFFRSRQIRRFPISQQHTKMIYRLNLTAGMSLSDLHLGMI